MTRVADLAELVRAPAALSVPGDVVAGAAAAGALGPRTPALAAASVLLYWGGMAANDWADRELDAVERPERPIPSGRVSPGLAVGLAAGLTVAGVGLAAVAGGRRAAAVAVPLAAAVWGYDLVAKNTAAGPPVMAACRGLDVLLGAAGGRRPARALPAALTVAAHTWTVTALSRREVDGADSVLPLRTLAGTALVAASAAIPARPGRAHPATGRGPAGGGSGAVPSAGGTGRAGRRAVGTVAAALPAVLAGWYATRYGGAQARVVARPTADRVRAAVGAGITGLPALQGALTARAGAGLLGLAVAAAAPLGRRLARKVSPT
ncbi:4-hydroxybenzoate polyprenyltransferase [Micromonospora zingiberis]|uniref:4-hydroxybenzoate polyprenyltransferase n=1 Tax=Micromonospora zingiberis TaxID=2053011 RepID=A0A4R0GM28_9ACTN|nr:UbiA family prenyltransferase [Micromonospora zingiberis]TCB96531.1 4-hydroxybenzoate polyprenyltransferase [Micromonospora zingiberis]